MKRIAFAVSWFYKTFTPSTILVTIFHICTCDDVTLGNEKSIVLWKYMISNMKCVFNVNFQYNHTQVPTAYYSMMFNIHKHISFNFCVGTQVWRVWNLQSKNNVKVDFSSAAIFYWPFSSVIDRNRKSSEEGGTSIVNHFHQQPRVTWSILTTKVNVKNTFTSHFDKKIFLTFFPFLLTSLKNTFTSHIDKKYFWHFCWPPYLYTFSLYEK